MLAKTLLVATVALMAVAPPISAQIQDAHAAYAPPGPPLTLSVAGAYPVAPGEFTIYNGVPVTLDLFFNPPITQYGVLAAAWAMPEVGPWGIFAVGFVPASQSVSFTGVVPPSLSGYSFALVLVGAPPAGQILFLDPVIVHVGGSPPA